MNCSWTTRAGARPYFACVKSPAVTLALALYLMALTSRPAIAVELQRPDTGKKIKVFILAGQSNMEGRADGNKLSPEERGRIAAVQDRVQLAFNHEPVGPLDSVAPPEEIAAIYKVEHIFGPELFFGIAVAEAKPDDKILLIKRTAGSTSLHGAWNPEWSADKAAAMDEGNEPRLYVDLIAYVREILSHYQPAEYELCAMLWVQGETDSGKEPGMSEYGRNLASLVRHVREDTRTPSLPFLLFQVGEGKVVEGMKWVARSVPGVTLIPQSLEPGSPDFYEKIENGHYNSSGQKKLGLKFASVFLDSERSER